MRLTLRSLAAFYNGQQLVRGIGGGDRTTYSCELENFGSEVLKHGGHIHGRLGADAHLVLCVLLEETLDTTAWELWERSQRVRGTLVRRCR
jgi:hypothetical protein